MIIILKKEYFKDEEIWHQLCEILKFPICVNPRVEDSVKIIKLTVEKSKAYKVVKVEKEISKLK